MYHRPLFPLPPVRAISASMLLCAGLLLSACAGLGGRHPGVEPGVSNGAEVIALYGQPARSWPETDGGQTLEYSSQPFGQTCYMVRLGADGKLIGIEDTLQQASRFSIAAGMTPEQVSRRLGRERSRVFFQLSGEEVWDWNVAPDVTGYPLRFNVHFKDGVVLRTSQSMVFPDRRLPFGRD